MERDRFLSRAPPRREKSLIFSVGVLGVLSGWASLADAAGGEPLETDLEELRRCEEARETELPLAKGSVFRKRGCWPFLEKTDEMAVLVLAGGAEAEGPVM